MKIKLITVLASVVLLSACASSGSEYYQAVQHANEQRALVEIEQAKAESERLRALQTIATQGDETARTAAVMAITFAGNSNQSNGNPSGMQNPRQQESNSDIALRWASVLVPSLTNLYGINRNAAVQQQQIAANRDTTIHGNETMLGFGRLTAGKDVPIVGGNDERLLYPVDPNSPVIGNQEDVLLYPRNPSDEAIVGTEDDVLLLPQQ
jgi:hypothetical protein